MDSESKKQKLNTIEIARPSLSKKRRVSRLLPIASHSLSKTQEAMKKQNDVALFLAGKVISTVDKNSNFVFSPASINSVLTMLAAISDNETLKSCILSFLRSSSTDELNDIFREIASVVLVDGSKRGGPKIAVANGVWREQSLPCSPESKDLFENFFKADFAQVDFRSKVKSLCETSA
ncbi:hypothetical protein ARALYDRAFT_893032 [Arabidopsis lyrata subsp. lyrata]|uniref:Serpin domain-containing protein n=1 Tax=Arabidopsis lyrata subsp. lyrata TaxID=81972 RepID=D7KSW6_ARALL|nr:hypothetical protein ARALYDRAFT_893032 [Arabidopsis lyrata subsp. lyrata]